MKRYHKCSCCGKFMKCIQENWTNVGIEYIYECKCGAYEHMLEEE